MSIQDRHIRNNLAVVWIVALTVLVLSGCYQDRPSDKPPIHLNPSMDLQPKYKAQSSSEYFLDGASMRVPPEGTVARGELRADLEYYTGKNKLGEYVKKSPRPVTPQLLKRGQQRYNIYCSPCHGRVGDGRGIVTTRGLVPPPTYHADLYRGYPDGQIFDVITNGIRNMPSYKVQVPVEDRWAIVSYIRALQRAQNATLKDIPADKRDLVK